MHIIPDLKNKMQNMDRYIKVRNRMILMKYYDKIHL